MQLDLVGKRVLVTGGSRGIGRAIALGFLQEKACVATCARGEDGLVSLRAEAPDGAVLYTDVVDILDGDAASDWFARATEALGGLDILVSNASSANGAVGDQLWVDGMQIDLLQHVRLVERALPLLYQSGQSSITFINSTSSRTVDVPRAFTAYAAFKAALLNYASQIALRHAKHGVRVNSVSPGPIVVPGGPWGGAGDADTELYKTYAARSGFGRLGTPEEVARAVTFLASPAASWISNVNLRIDGGADKTPNY